MHPLPRLAGRHALLVLLCASLRADEPVPFPNPGFEAGLAAWTPTENDLARAIARAESEAARSGKSGLRIAQQAGDTGSWVRGPLVAVEPGAHYRVAFDARLVAQDGIGVWLQFHDHAGAPLADQPERAVLVPDNARDWTALQLEVTAPREAAALSFAVHGYNRRAVVADFDDFSVTRLGRLSPAASVSDHSLRPDPARVEQIAAALPAIPRGLGPDLADRAAWTRLGAGSDFREKTVARARRYEAEATPVVTGEMWDEARRNRDRKFDGPVNQRRFRLVTFVLAEGIENRGEFLPATEREIAAICSETSWILPGHAEFSGGRNDLGTAMTAWNLAAADTLLGDRLSPAARASIRSHVRERVLRHHLAVVRGEQKPEWWSLDPNNWNAVVHAGVVGSALALLDSPTERAEIVAGAELGIRRYLDGFPSDGYSPEGSGYWKYGFGHYLLLSETVLAATGGEVNLYNAGSALVAQFPRRFALAPDLYPSYGDNPFMDPSSHWMNHVVDRRYGLRDGAARPALLDPMYGAFLYAYAVNLAFADNAPAVVAADVPVVRGHRLRDWFDVGQVYVGRLPEGRHGLAVSFRGGNNGLPHGHHDLGSYVVALDGRPVLVDPGATVYDNQTFGPDRFKHPVLNSLGHPVPVVAGAPQRDGSAAAAAVGRIDFQDDKDVVELDLARGYDVPGLRSLVRRFTYEREGSGAFVVQDHVVFDRPRAFASAVVTYGEAREERPGTWLVTYRDRTLRIDVSASHGARVVLREELLEKPSRHGPVRRVAIELAEPAAETVLTVSIRPASPAP